MDDGFALFVVELSLFANERIDGNLVVGLHGRGTKNLCMVNVEAGFLAELGGIVDFFRHAHIVTWVA